MICDEVSDKQVPDLDASGLKDRVAARHQDGPGIAIVLIAIVGDQAADGHPCAGIEQGQHRVKDRAANIFEIDIDPTRTGLGQVFGKGGTKVRDTGIKA